MTGRFAWPRLVGVVVVPSLMLAGCDADTAEPPRDENLPRASIQPPTVRAALARLPEFSVLRGLLADTGRTDMLGGAGPVTLFAPRDTAFAQLGEAQRATLADPAARDALARTLDMLIVPETLRGDELRQRVVAAGGSLSLPARNGSLAITLESGQIVVTAPTGVKATAGTQDIGADNGAIYVLDRWPGAPPQTTARR